MPDRLDPKDPQGIASIPLDGRITSKNGVYSLVMQNDGNLVLYQYNCTPFWATYTAGQPAANATMLKDGNFVVYSKANDILWSSQTAANPGSYVVMQDDGNLVIYAPGPVAIWSTGTWHNNSVMRPVEKREDTQIGNFKDMHTQATLTRNGNLTIQTLSHSGHPTEGLHGRVIVECLDWQDNVIWITPEFQCKTCGSIGDLFTHSTQTDTFIVNLPELIGCYTKSLRVFQDDGTTGVDRDQVIANIKQGAGVVADVWKILQPIVATLS
jgi:hypothetical protein